MTASGPIQIIRFSPHLSLPINGIHNANSNRNNYLTMGNNAPAVTYKIKACYQDPVTKQHFFLWSHVQAVIKDAAFAVDADDGTLVPFMVNEAYEEFVPRRIVCNPDKIFDVVASTESPLDPQYPSNGTVQSGSWFRSEIWPLLKFPVQYFVIMASMGMAIFTYILLVEIFSNGGH